MSNYETINSSNVEKQQQEPCLDKILGTAASGIISWNNTENRSLVHSESFSGAIEKRPLIRILSNQFVVIESAGKRIIVTPGISSILQGKIDTKTLVWLMKAGYDPTHFFSSCETILYFIDTKDHQIVRNAELSILDNNIHLSVPFILSVRLGIEQIKGLFDQDFDWSSDEAVTDLLYNMATEAVKQELEPVISNCFMDRAEISSFEIQKILHVALNPRFLTDLANQINRKLCWKGLTLSKRIEIDYQSVIAERTMPEASADPNEADEPKLCMEGNFGFFHYYLPDGGGAVISKFKSGVLEAVIPEVICNQPVVAIADEAFKQCDDLVSVVISSSVQTIGKHAFNGCHSLRTVTFSDQLTHIDDWAFADCNSLHEIHFGKNTTDIGDYCFFQCTSLSLITFQESVKLIGDYSFSNCSSLTNLNLPTKLEKIGVQAFSGCSQLTSVSLPASLSFIGKDAFSHCSPQLSFSLSIGSYSENWCKANSIPYSTPFRWGKNANSIVLLEYTGHDQVVTIPDKVQGKPVVAIADRAFFNNPVIQEIRLPDKLEMIGAYAFSRCTRLETVRFPSTIARIDFAAFSGCSSIKEITIPGSLLRISNGMMENCQSLKKVIISRGVQQIGSKSFQNCSSLETVDLPGSLYKIGMMAFSRCRSLQVIRVPEGVIEIEPSAFANCSSLELVYLPQTLSYIGSDVFSDCSNKLVCHLQSSQMKRWFRKQGIKIII